MPLIDVIAFDADDTLWHNESIYSASKNKLVDLLSPYASEQDVELELDKKEGKNISSYGYGIKGFTLSMIETAIDLADGRIRGEEIRRIIDFGKEMLSLEVQLFENVNETLSQLAVAYTLMIISKGDLLDQERKLAQSGIDKFFDYVEIVSEKNEETYEKVLAKYHIQPGLFMMVGNSLKSDILPVTRIGGYAVHIPAEINWALDVVEDDHWVSENHYEIERIEQLPALIDRHIDL
jgi:putative hydrolase of the HAD superfamily